jgi:hypothetical protein
VRTGCAQHVGVEKRRCGDCAAAPSPLVHADSGTEQEGKLGKLRKPGITVLCRAVVSNISYNNGTEHTRCTVR